MGIPHPEYNFKRIVAITVFVIAFQAICLTAYAYDSLFIIDDIKVDVTAENSVMAQNQAFELAQQQAFEALTQRMVEEAQANSVEMPDMLTISSLVKDYEVTDEQLSAVRYIGTYRFRFREDAVSQFFSVSGLTFTETSSRPLLVLPVFQINGRNTLWSENNIWMQAWASAKLSGGLVPVEVPIGDLMDISDIDENQALSYERHKLDRMLGRYNAKEAAIMIGVPDAALSESSDFSAAAIGRLRISVYRTDRAEAEHVQDLIIESNGKESVEELYERGVTRAYQALQKDWKSKTLSSAEQSQKYVVRVTYRNLDQWTRIQRELGNVPGLHNLSVTLLKRNEAHLSFSFRGDELRLRDLLKRSNYYLGQTHQNGNTPVYDLEYGQNKKTSNGFYRSVEPASGKSDIPKNGIHTF